MQTLGSVASMIAALREDAAAEAEHIEQTLNAEVTAIREEATALSVAIPDRDLRLAAARRQNDERLAHQEWEGRRMALEQREAWIARVVEKARQERRCDLGQLKALVREALQTIGATECQVALAERDRQLVDPALFGAGVQLTTAPIAGGCIVSAGDIVFDNSFEARSRRLEPEWRNTLSEAYR